MSENLTSKQALLIAHRLREINFVGPRPSAMDSAIEFLAAVGRAADEPSGEQNTEAIVWAQRVHEDLAKYTQEDGQMIHVRANRALGILFAEVERLEKLIYMRPEPSEATRYWSYLDKYAPDHVHEASTFLCKLMCDYADRGGSGEAKAAMVGTAVDFLSQWVMLQEAPETKPVARLPYGCDYCEQSFATVPERAKHEATHPGTLNGPPHETSGARGATTVECAKCGATGSTHGQGAASIGCDRLDCPNRYAQSEEGSHG